MSRIKTVIITGASSGIGRALAILYSRRGYRVGLLARRENKLKSICETLSHASDTGMVAYAHCDVTDAEGTKKAVDALEQKLGPTDIMIANAGIAKAFSARQFDLDHARHMYDVNVFGALNAFSAVVPGMIERHQGFLVGISSLASYASLPGSSGYSATKAALNRHLAGLRLELRQDNIQVSTMCPGFIRTPLVSGMKSLPFLMSSEKAATKIADAIQRGKKTYHFPIPTYLAVRALSVLPDRLLESFFAH